MTTRTLRRAAAAVLALSLLAAPAALAADADDSIVQGAGIAAAAVLVGNVDPDVDVWPLYSESSIDNESSHGLSGAIWPGFLVDAFFFLYGVQPQMRAGMGISESQWPNPPHVSQASSTGFFTGSFADGCEGAFGAQACDGFFSTIDPAPVGGGESRTESARLRSQGSARGTRFDIPGVLEATEGRASTISRFVGGRTLVESVFTARDVTIGGVLHIDFIEARSLAAAASRHRDAEATSTLRITGADFGGDPVVFDSQGFHVQGDRSTDELNAALAAQGIELRPSRGRQTVADDGSAAEAATGGLQVTILRERVEETFPAAFRSQKDALCAAAADNPLNAEITRIRFDEANPLYGQVPLPGVPERAQLEQSVPPPLSCPFMNRNFDMTLALGFTNASARLSPLPDLAPPAVLSADVGGGDGISAPTYGQPAPAAPVPAPMLGGAPAETVPELTSELAAAPSSAEPAPDLPRWVRIFYGLIMALALVAIGFRFVLRSASAP